MPLTLDRLFSKTVTSPLEWDGDTVLMTWAPARYTGEMEDTARLLSAAEDAANEEIVALLASGDAEDAARARKIKETTEAESRRVILESLSALLVTWDLLDGKKPYPTDVESLRKLPGPFVMAAFLALGEENQADPQNAPSSEDGSRTPSSAPALTGTPSSEEPVTLASRRGKSKHGRTRSDSIRSGARGR